MTTSEPPVGPGEGQLPGAQSLPPAPAPYATTSTLPPSAAQKNAQKKPGNLALVALIVGIVAFLVGLVPVLGAIVGVAAVVLGIVALRKRQSKGMAVAGIVLGGIALLSSTVTTAGIGAMNNASANKPAAVITESASPEAQVAAQASTPVPDVAGLTGDKAKDALEAAGFKVDWDAGDETVVLASRWVVLSTDPAAGSLAGDGETVTVTVARPAVPSAAPAVPSAAPAVPAAPAEPAVPADFKSAVKKAQSYSDNLHMSKAGVYDQLTSEYGEQFSPEAAQYGIDNVRADWNANALAKAKSYQEEMAMSPEAIRDQLTSEYGEKFLPEEADYAIAHLND